MKIITLAAAAGQMGIQIQRSFGKIGFKITGAKAGGVDAKVQAVADLKQVYVSLKRVAQKLGEKIIWPRMSLYELLQAASVLEGGIYLTGTDAALSYGVEFYMEINQRANVYISGGDYLELNVENAVAGLGMDVIGLAYKISNMCHLRVERYSFQANEFKTLQATLPDDHGQEVAALKLLVPNTISDGRVNCLNPYSIDATDVNGWVKEKGNFFIHLDEGRFGVADYAPIDSDVNNRQGNVTDHVKSIDITNGATPASVIMLRNAFYK